MTDGIAASSRRVEQPRSMLSRIFERVRRLFSRPREIYRPDGEPFPELDLNEVRARLSIGQRAIENGERGLPPADARTFDQVERDITTLIVGEQGRAHSICQQQLHVFNERIRHIEVEILRSNIAARMQSACADLRTLGLRGRNELFEHQRKVSALAKELREFKTAHLLDREAEYPESLILHWSILALMLLTEATLNGGMLGQGTKNGLIEAYTQATVLAALNLTIGGFLGRVALPLLRHGRMSLRAVGLFLFACGVAGSILFNLAVGHYRDELGGDPLVITNPGGQAIADLVTHTFQLADILSYGLFALGLLFAIVATIDTYRMDDRYLGYGRISRRNQVTRDDFIAERQHLIGEVTDLRDGAFRDLHQVAEQIARAGQQNASLAHQQLDMIQRFSGYQNHLESSGRLLLSEYRAANERVRKSSGPGYFRDEWRLQRISMTVPEHVSRAVEELSSHLDQYRGDVMRGFDDAMSQIKSVDELIDSGERSALT